MIVIRALATPFIIAAVLLCCCGPAAEIAFPPTMVGDPIELSGGYSLGTILLGGLKLYEPSYVLEGDTTVKYPIVVDQAVVRIGWNEDFILAERHPLGHWIGDKPDSDHPAWYIVVVSTGEVRSNLSYDEFVFLRQRVLHVPDTIEMRDARDVYYDR